MPSRSTLLEVARLAGVSIATASRVLNGGPRTPSEESRRKVLEAAARIDYRPNAVAQAVAKGHANMIGLIVHDITDPYFATIAGAVLEAAEENGITTTVADTRRQPEREAELLSHLHEQRVRAVIIAGSRTTDPGMRKKLMREVTAFTASGGRVAMISERQEDITTVSVENRAGARALAHQMVDLGHSEFAVLSGPSQVRTSAERVAGFRRGLIDRGIELPRTSVLSSAFSRDGGWEAANTWLRSGIPATCLFAVNDVMAVGVIAALRERGVSVPLDVSVAGFDDIPTIRDFSPTLTTVRIPMSELGAEAVRLVLEESDGGSPKVRTYRGEVVLRESTRAIGEASASQDRASLPLSPAMPEVV